MNKKGFSLFQFRDWPVYIIEQSKLGNILKIFLVHFAPPLSRRKIHDLVGWKMNRPSPSQLFSQLYLQWIIKTAGSIVLEAHDRSFLGMGKVHHVDLSLLSPQAVLHVTGVLSWQYQNDFKFRHFQMDLQIPQYLRDHKLNR